MTRVWRTIGKAIVAGVGAVATAVATGLLHGQVLLVANGIIAIATVVGVYHAPSAPITLSGK